MDLEILITGGLFAAAVLTLAVWRFGGGRYGRLRPSGEVDEAYAGFRVDPDRHYYTSGPDSFPNALMGLEGSWILEGDLWKKRDLSREGMGELVRGMQARAMERGNVLHGFDIVDDRGKTVGDWFSVAGLNILIKRTGEDRIVITTPVDPDSVS